MNEQRLRGDLTIGTVSNQSIFHLQGEKISAIRQRYAPDLQWLVMTSPEVHQQTLISFDREHYYGVPREAIRFFQQESLPVLDDKLNPVITNLDKYLTSPTGHGNFLKALQNNGLIEWLQHIGVEYLFHFQYPNVLERVCDPVMIGYHHITGSDVTTKGIRCYSSSEKVGRINSILDSKGREQLRIIEYYFLEDTPDIELWNSLPTSTGTHIWSISFLQRCIDLKVKLPIHRVPHSQKMNGRKSLWKVEFFAFDLFPYAEQIGLVIAERNWEYSMVKNPSGMDTLKTAREDLVRMYKAWLEKAGAIAKGHISRVEIRPQFALWVDELCEKLPSGFMYSDGLILDKLQRQFI